MKPRITWLLFLIVGSITMINIGCEKPDVDTIVITKYQYINSCGKYLQMRIFDSSNNLLKDSEVLIGDTLTFVIRAEGGAGPFQFENAEHGDSIYLNFANERFQIYRKNFDNIFFEKSYEKVKISNKEFHLFYKITKQDYDNATMIE